MDLTTSIETKVVANQTKTGGLSTPVDALTLAKALALADGVAVSQADRIYQGRRTLAAGASEDLDLAGTTLTDQFGVALTFARVKVVFIAALATNPNPIIVGGAAGSPWIGPFGAGTHTLSWRPGEFKMLACTGDATAYPVTPTTADLLRVLAGAG